MKTTNNNVVDKIKATLDIVDLIGRSVRLNRQTNGLYVGAISSLSKSGASLKVDRGLQLWHDLSGHAKPAGGDVFSWIAYENNLDEKTEFSEVLKIAADLAGIELEEVSEEQKQKIEKKKQVHELLTKAAEVYHSHLTPEIRAYITSKWGISNEMIDRLKIGYAKAESGNCNLGKIADSEEWLETGLFNVKQKDFSKTGKYTQTAFEIFKGRVVFPYWHGGKVVNFAARGDFATPINTPNLPWEVAGTQIIKYRKLLTHSEKHPYVNEAVNNAYIWGEDSLKGNDYCIITEGIADSIILMQNDYPVLSPITTKFAAHDIENLLYSARKLKTVYICNDNEDSGAGEDGAIRTGILLKSQGINVKIMLLPRENLDKMDIAEYFLRHNKEEFEAVKEDSKDIFVHLLHKIHLSQNKDPAVAKTDNMLKAMEFTKKYLKNIKDEDEGLLFIRNNIKNYFPKFTADDIKIIAKNYKAVLTDSNNSDSDQERKMSFDIDSESGRSIMTQILAREILQECHVKYVAGSLRMYEEGYYPASSEALKTLQKKILYLALTSHRTAILEKHVNNVIKVLEIMTATKQSECNTSDDEVAVGNGILNLKTFKLTPFSPEKVFFNKLPINYVPNAPKPVQFLRLMEDVFRENEGQYDLMQEVFGLCLLNNYKYQTIIYLLGDGGNGKGTVLKILSYLLGIENVSSATLMQLTDHRNVEYYLAGLHGKRANICGDIGATRIDNTENIKKLSSNTDMISARLPYGQPFEFINTAKLIFALNKMPKRDTFTTGDKRRDCIISFNNKISDSEKDIKGFAEIIRDSGEMPGVLNWAIEGLKRLELNQKFSDKRTVAEKGIEYDKKSNPMKYFVDECIEEDPRGGYVPNALIYAAYETYRKQHGMPELSEAELKNGLKYWCDQIGIKTTEKREYLEKILGLEISPDVRERLGKRPHVFTGIKLADNSNTAIINTCLDKAQQQITVDNRLKDEFNTAFS